MRARRLLVLFCLAWGAGLRGAAPEAVDADQQFNLGLMAFGQGKLEVAEAAFGKACQAAPKDAEAHELLGKVLLQEGKWDPALRALKDALALEPGRVESERNLGLALGKLGRTTEAIEAFQAAEGKLPQDAGLKINLGLLWLRAQDPDKALAAFEAARSLSPSAATVQANLCQLYAQKARYDEAVSACRAALKGQDERPANAEYNLGFSLMKQDKAPEARAHLEAALRLDPSLATADYDLGLLSYRDAALEDAVRHFRAALEARKGAYPQARYNLAVALGDLGRWQEALQQYQELVAKNPKDDDARFNLAYVKAKGAQDYLAQGLSHYLAGRYAEAAGEARSALDLDPDNATAKSMLAGSLQRSKGALKLDERALAAQKALEAEVKAQASQDAALPQQAEKALQAGHTGEAVRTLDYAVRHDPKNQGLRRSLYKARSRQLSQAEAAPTKDQVALEQKAQELYFQGVKLYLKGEVEAAAEAWKAVLAMDRGHLEAQRDLARATAELEALKAFKR